MGWRSVSLFGSSQAGATAGWEKHQDIQVKEATEAAVEILFNDISQIWIYLSFSGSLVRYADPAGMSTTAGLRKGP